MSVILLSRGRVVKYLEVLSDLTNKTLEGELADEQLGRLLVATDLAESDGSRPEAVRLLNTTSRSLRKGVRIKRKNQARIRKLTAAVDLRAADLAASCLRGALPPVDLRAVCLVRAIV